MMTLRKIRLRGLMARLAAFAIVLPPILLATTVQAQEPAESPAPDASARTSCLICHGDPDIFDEEDLVPVHELADSVHGAATLSCHDCHGGNPDSALGDDMDLSMSADWTQNPYVGSPERGEVPGFCGRCHSDPQTMARFDPDASIDQEREYWTSQHGEALAKGDANVATCVDCHGSHDMKSAEDPRSRVHPTKVADTCGDCHADAVRMAGYSGPSGRSLPVNQTALWRQSVHANAMFKAEDLSAPTCNDCHGNHGAAPPGLTSLAFVCGQCHGREAELFRASDKHDLLADHREYLLDAGEDGCVACHEEPEPQALFEVPPSLGECDSCHGHHAIVRPTVAMLAPLPETPCAFCHEAVVAEGVPSATADFSGEAYEAVRDSLLEVAPGDSRELRFDWLVDQAQMLPNHTEIAGGEAGDRTVLRAEFERLFTKFRIGKAHYDYVDPASGETVQAKVRSCGDCHGPEPLLGDPEGHDVAGELLSRMRQLTSVSSRAERQLLVARRGGVEVGEAEMAIDGAVDAQIELETLVHGFSVDEGGSYLEKHAEGMAFAEQALSIAEEAKGELSFRRLGLLVSLLFIVLMLISLALFIRRLPESPSEEGV